MQWLKSLINMALPTSLFYVLYKVVGIIPAVIISGVYSFGILLYEKKRNGTVKNSQIIGVIGLIGSALAIGFTGNEKYYYVPSLIENVIFLGFMLVLTMKKKSVLHFLAKDFGIESLEQIPEDDMLNVNLLWMFYFGVKIASKIMGLLYLDFEKLYWLVFLLGDPMTIIVIVLSVIMIRKGYAQKEI